MAASNYYQRARESILRDLCRNPAHIAFLDMVDMGVAVVEYQVVLYEKYVSQQERTGFSFHRFLRMGNPENHNFEEFSMGHVQAVLLKGKDTLGRFAQLIEQYREQTVNLMPTGLDSALFGGDPPLL